MYIYIYIQTSQGLGPLFQIRLLKTGRAQYIRPEHSVGMRLRYGSMKFELQLAASCFGATAYTSILKCIRYVDVAHTMTSYNDV